MLLTVLGVLLPGTMACADMVRYHYVAANPCAPAVLQPGPNGAVGEWRPWRYSLVRQPYSVARPTTHMVTFLHPYTGRNIIVPMSFPESQPRLEVVRERVVYNYGTFTIEAQFNPDGSVDTIYNGGLLKRL
jgi:hypothetical protein